LDAGSVSRKVIPPGGRMNFTKTCILGRIESLGTGRMGHEAAMTPLGQLPFFIDFLSVKTLEGEGESL
jgi:hypothetical protein